MPPPHIVKLLTSISILEQTSSHYYCSMSFDMTKVSRDRDRVVAILQFKPPEDDWGGFYAGSVEPRSQGLSSLTSVIKIGTQCVRVMILISECNLSARLRTGAASLFLPAITFDSVFV